MSDSGDMLMVDFWRLSNGGEMAPAGCRSFESYVHAMKISVRLRFFGSGTLPTRIVLSQCA